MTFLCRTYQLELDHITDAIKRQTENGLLLKVLGHPHLPRLALALQYLMLKQRNFSPDEIRTYCTSTVLLQIGLNIHDDVSAKDEPLSNPDAERERQLRVLAGDLHSGKFYQLLAHQNAVEVIHFLSDAICRINTAKMNLHAMLQEGNISIKKVVSDLEHIYASLFKTWLQRSHKPNDAAWEAIASDLLVAEKIQHNLGHPRASGWPQNVLSQLRHRVQHMVAHARFMLEEWEESDIKQELAHLIDTHFPGAVTLDRIAEEI